jgi:hypothetical protein
MPNSNTEKDLKRKGFFGFEIEVPISLIKLGSTLSVGFQFNNYKGNIIIVQKCIDENASIRTTNVKISGKGLVQHTYDRFGRYSWISVALILECSLDDLLFEGLIEFFIIDESKNFGSLIVSEKGLRWATKIINDFIDIYSISFNDYWILRLTYKDLQNVKIIEEDKMKKSFKYISMGLGTSAGHIRMGVPYNYPCEDLDALNCNIKRLPLYLWEECIISAYRELEVENFRSAIMEACLGFESFVSQILKKNESSLPGGKFYDSTLKRMCTKQNLLPTLLGSNLDSRVHGEYQIYYRKISKLRDHVMHNGNLNYEWTDLNNNHIQCQISSYYESLEHIKMAQDLCNYLIEKLTDKNFSIK